MHACIMHACMHIYIYIYSALYSNVHIYIYYNNIYIYVCMHACFHWCMWIEQPFTIINHFAYCAFGFATAWGLWPDLTSDKHGFCMFLFSIRFWRSELKTNPKSCTTFGIITPCLPQQLAKSFAAKNGKYTWMDMDSMKVWRGEAPRPFRISRSLAVSSEAGSQFQITPGNPGWIAQFGHRWTGFRPQRCQWRSVAKNLKFNQDLPEKPICLRGEVPVISGYYIYDIYKPPCIDYIRL